MSAPAKGAILTTRRGAHAASRFLFPAHMVPESSAIHDWRQMVAAAFAHCAAVAVHPADAPGTGPEPDDLQALVESACDDPIDSPPLSELLQEASRVAIVLPEEADAVSPVTVSCLLARVARHAPHAHREVLSTPTGTNPLAPAGLRPHSERRAARPPYRPLVASAPVLHPTTGEILPVLLDPGLLEADVIVAAHRIRPDALLGLAGGSAAVLVGNTSPRTLQLLRPGSADPAAGGDPLLARRHPLHRGFRRIARHLPPIFALAECTGDDAFACASGQPDAVLDAMTGDGDAPIFRPCDQHDALVLFVDREEARDLSAALVPYLHLVRQPHPPLHPRAPVVLVPAADLPGVEDPPPAAQPPRIDMGSLNAMVTAACARHPLHVVHPSPGRLPPGVRTHRSFAQAIRVVEIEHTVRRGTGGLDLLLTRGASRMLPVARAEAEHRPADTRPS